MTTEELLHPKRDLQLEAAENVRDLGGYRTAQGTVTQWHRFVRSGDMDQLTSQDQEKLTDHGIGTVIDLRMQWEIRDKPNVFENSDRVRFLIHDFWGDRFDDYRSQNRTAPAAEKLADLYCAGLVQSGFIMAAIVATFAEDTGGGYVFHCRSGKDRTGLVAALLLAIAGVPEKTICADFALTAEYLKGQAVNPIDMSAPGAWQRGCDVETMARTLGFLQQEYGGVVAYLMDVGVSEAQIERVRGKLLN